MFCKKR